MRILAIDPGVRGVGAAVFFNGTLQTATYITNPFKTGKRLDSACAMATEVRNTMPHHVDAVLIEVPRSYSAGQQKGPQDDLIDVALISAACAKEFWSPSCGMVSYYPSEWKGSVKAEVFLKRILERLTPVEKAAIKLVGKIPLEEVPDSDSLDHNTIDAVGIGLKYLGRLDRARVYARD